MRDHDDWMTIGAFARATGVAVSALRFYDECGLVRPGHVDPATGYRYYSVEQIAEVALIRHLRDVGLPLAQVRQVLAAEARVAQGILTAHLRDIEGQLAAARTGTQAALELVRRRGCDRVVLPGRVLAAAIDQVAPAALPDGEPRVLTGVLIEARDEELHLVATDRYRLAVRSVPLPGSGGTFTAVVPSRAVQRLTRWLVAHGDVTLSVGPDRILLEASGSRRPVLRLADAYPDHRVLLANLPEPVTTLAVARRDLLAALGDDPSTLAELTAGPKDLTVRTGTVSDAMVIAAEVTGPATSISFAVGTLRPVVHAAVGPDVLLHIGGPGLPVLVRSADDGGLTSLAMPVRPSVRSSSEGAA